MNYLYRHFQRLIMLWIVQKNLHHENRRGELLQALERLDIPFLAVNINQDHRLNCELPIEYRDNSLPIITNGSIMLSNIARKQGWLPGSLLNDNFSYAIWADHYHDLLLNKDAQISSLQDARVDNHPEVFVRPILDNKSFNGKVFTQAEFLAFQHDSVKLKAGMPKPDIEILVSVPKTIGQEHRHYIVNGEIVTSSRYKLAGQPNFKEGCDEHVLDVVKEAISRWTPAPAFVLDTYIAGDDVGIVEIGCISHAGLYESNLMKLVHALDMLQDKFYLKAYKNPPLNQRITHKKL